MDFLNDIMSSPITPYIVLAIGFVLLVKGADLFVDGSASLARRLGVSAAIVGLTIVAMGTSAPEAAVSITAGIKETFFGAVGESDMAVGNILGSNLFNLLFILGLCMMIKPIPTAGEFLKRDFPWSLATTLLFIPMILDGKLALYEGIILVVLFASYIGRMVYKSIKDREVVADDIKNMSLGRSAAFLALGLAMVACGGPLVTSAANDIATSFGMSSKLAGLTICAIGTSLPELVTSLVASRKGESELAVGNVIGSNIFNLLFILGTTVTISGPMSVDSVMMVDTLVLLAVTAMVFIFSFTGRRCGRAEGAVTFICYLAYLTYIIMRDYSIM